MNGLQRLFVSAALLGAALAAPAFAGEDTDTINLFKGAGRSSQYFNTAYGYAVFPNIGKGGIIVGGARGEGHTYVHGQLTGDTVMNQISVGFQLGGEDYSEIIFFKDKSAYDNFTSGNFEFDANASVTAITANASASAGTEGAQGSASGGEHDAATGGGYYKGMAVFTIAKGGLMYAATIAGQKFEFTPVKR
jgi:lipid-binding SYLF domain-containing protein